ncbi:MAG: hypothetical protein AAF682_08320 [Planctomycetota bacterium]
MLLRLLTLIAALFVVAPSAAPAPVQQSFSHEINQAIDRGIQRVLAWQNADGSFGGAGHQGKYPMGQTALAVYTLLKSGLPRTDPAIQLGMRYLRELPYEKTYSVSCWILALDATRDRSVEGEIHRAAAWLESVFNDRDDLWAYPDGEGELSCTQFAVLGLWTAERRGYEVDKRVWADLIQGTLDMQNDDGGFGYRPSDRPYSQGAMVTAGITSLEIAVAALEDDSRFKKVRKLGQEGLERAWTWMERHFTPTGNPAYDTGILVDRHKITKGRLHMFHYYYLWGVERIAAIGGRHDIAGRDWYREGAVHLLKEEEPSGGWNQLDTTAFGLLFLRRATYSGLAGREQEKSVPRAIRWHYTTDQPPEGWEKVGFNATSWRIGSASFGDWKTSHRRDRTLWDTPDIWIRREFDWRKEPEELQLFAMHDDSIEIYLNGVKAASSSSSSAQPKEYEVSDEARATLKEGINVLAAHCRDAGGACTVDVWLNDLGGMAARLGKTLDEEPTPPLQTPPGPEVPFLRRWLALGPIDDKKHDGFADDLIEEAEATPVEGQRAGRQVWREVRSSSSLVDLPALLKPREKSIYYAFTHLNVAREVEAILWLGFQDGGRVWLDGKLLLSHHEHGPPKRDELPIRVHLSKGMHRLLVKIEQHGETCGLIARFAGLDGSTLQEVRPVLAGGDPNWEAVALAQPELFGYERLAALLPLDTSARVDFDKAGSLDRLATSGAADGYPRWHSGKSKRSAVEAAHAPNPGAKGLVELLPASADHPARLLWRVRVPTGEPQLGVRYSTDVKNPQSSALVRVWAYGANLERLGEHRAKAPAKPAKKEWQQMRCDFSSVAGQDVIVVVEALAEEQAAGSAAVFLDQLILEQKK